MAIIPIVVMQLQKYLVLIHFFLLLLFLWVHFYMMQKKANHITSTRIISYGIFYEQTIVLLLSFRCVTHLYVQNSIQQICVLHSHNQTIIFSIVLFSLLLSAANAIKWLSTDISIRDESIAGF